MEDDFDFYDDDDLVPEPRDRSLIWDYSVILIGGLLCGWLTDWVLSSVAAQFGIGNLAEWATTLKATEAASNAEALRALSVVSSVGNFVLPTLFFVHFFYDLWGYQYINANRFPRLANGLSGIILMLMAMPMIQYCFALNANLVKAWHIPINTFSKTASETLLIMPDDKTLIINLLVMAIIPAIAEEFWFRGIIQRVIGRSFLNAHSGIWIAAVWFSLYHNQLDGFIPRMLLGVMLGYMAYWSSSIWTSIFAHAVFNSISIFVVYFNPNSLKTATENTTSFWAFLISFVFTLVFALCLHVINHHNRREYVERLVENV